MNYCEVSESTWITFEGPKGRKYAFWDGYTLSRMMSLTNAKKNGFET